MITTFYSYKGGVGRSLALVNVGRFLADNGFKVLLIDFDLEAPGLYKICDVEQKKSLDDKNGLLDLIKAYRARVDTHEGYEPDDEKKIPIHKYYLDISKTMKTQGQVYLMPAGNQKKEYQYQLNLHQIHWPNFFLTPEDGAKGFVYRGRKLFDYLKQKVKELGFDFTLIDSHTGLIDYGDICLQHLPEQVVLVFSLNNQNIDGISKQKEKLDNKPNIQVILVASPFPGGDTELLSARMGELREKGLAPEVIIKIGYHSTLAVKEKIFTESESHEPIFQDYKKLAQTICRGRFGQIDALIDRGVHLGTTGHLERAVQLLEQASKNSKESHYRFGQIRSTIFLANIYTIWTKQMEANVKQAKEKGESDEEELREKPLELRDGALKFYRETLQVMRYGKKGQEALVDYQEDILTLIQELRQVDWPYLWKCEVECLTGVAGMFYPSALDNQNENHLNIPKKELDEADYIYREVIETLEKAAATGKVNHPNDLFSDWTSVLSDDEFGYHLVDCYWRHSRIKLEKGQIQDVQDATTLFEKMCKIFLKQKNISLRAQNLVSLSKHIIYMRRDKKKLTLDEATSIIKKLELINLLNELNKPESAKYIDQETKKEMAPTITKLQEMMPELQEQDRSS